MSAADEIVERLNLKPLPVEGGLFRQTYVASDEISADALPAHYGRAKSACTAIYYLLTDQPDSFSALHRLPTDEIYHFYMGDSVEMLLLHPDGVSDVVRLGHNLAQGEHVQFVAPAGIWQGSRLIEGGEYALMGTTMAPGYDDLDYQSGHAEKLERSYPDRAKLIRQLTR